MGRRVSLVAVGMLIAAVSPPGAAGASAEADVSPTPATFASPVSYHAGGVGNGLDSGDLDHDGDLDVVMVNNLGIAVLLGDGLGRLGSPTQFLAGSRATYLALGDVNGDATLDAVVANTEIGDSSISVLIGRGNGKFRPPRAIPTALRPWGIDLGDLDGDSVLDLVVPLWTDGAPDPEQPPMVSVWRGTGGGKFDLPELLPLPFGPGAIAAEDVDDDGALDLVVLSADLTPGFAVVFVGDGAGAFVARPELDVGSQPTAMDLADLDGDGLLDLVVTRSQASSASVFRGAGDGSFGAPQSFTTGLWPEDVVADDFNGDGVLDLATANSLNNNTSLLLGLGDGTVAPAVNTYVPPSVYRVSAADLNADARPDLLIAGPGSSDTRVLMNTTGVRLPTAPSSAMATGGRKSATVSWLAPADDGGSPITGYVVTPYIGYFPLPAQTFSSTATTQNVTGLTNGTTYRFRVQAINVVGTGGYSIASNAVIPNHP